jgi:hypothetical protein
MQNGSTIGPDVPEIPVGTAVVGGNFPDIRWAGKIQVLLDWMGQEHRVDPVGVVITIDRSFSVRIMYP